MRTSTVIVILLVVGAFLYQDHSRHVAHRDCVAQCARDDTTGFGPGFCRKSCDLKSAPALFETLWSMV